MEAGDAYPWTTKADLIHRAWGKSRALLTPDGHYRSDSNTHEVRAALADLAALRMHPDMQIFYEYLSPSGYINNHDL